MRPREISSFHEVTWLVRVRAAGTPSWILTPDPFPAPQVSSSPLPTGPAQRRLSVSPSIGGETGLVSCVLPEDLLTQILAERIQVGLCPHPYPCTELQGSHTIPVLGAEVPIHNAPTAAQNPGALDRKDGFLRPQQPCACPFDIPGQSRALVQPEATRLKVLVSRLHIF